VISLLHRLACRLAIKPQHKFFYRLFDFTVLRQDNFARAISIRVSRMPKQHAANILLCALAADTVGEGIIADQ